MVWSCQSTPLHRANAAVRCSFFQPRQAPGRGSWCPGGPGKQRMVSFELTPPAAGITPLFLWMPRRRARRLVWLACSLLQLVTYVCAKCIQGRPGGGSTRISTRKTIIRCSQPRLFRVRSSGFGARLRAPSPRRFTMSCTAVFRFAQRLCHSTSSSFEISSGRGPRTTRPGGSGWGCGWARGFFLAMKPKWLSGMKPKWLRDV